MKLVTKARADELLQYFIYVIDEDLSAELFDSVELAEEEIQEDLRDYINQLKQNWYNILKEAGVEIA